MRDWCWTWLAKPAGQRFLCCRRPFGLISTTRSSQESIITILLLIFNLMALVSIISSLCCIQVDHGRVGELSQILWQPGLSDPHRSLRAVPPRRNQPLGPQQVLQRREAREPAALQPSALSCPVEDGGVVRGGASHLQPAVDGTISEWGQKSWLK